MHAVRRRWAGYFSRFCLGRASVGLRLENLFGHDTDSLPPFELFCGRLYLRREDADTTRPATCFIQWVDKRKCEDATLERCVSELKSFERKFSGDTSFLFCFRQITSDEKPCGISNFENRVGRLYRALDRYQTISTTHDIAADIHIVRRVVIVEQHRALVWRVSSEKDECRGNEQNADEYCGNHASHAHSVSDFPNLFHFELLPKSRMVGRHDARKKSVFPFFTAGCIRRWLLRGITIQRCVHHSGGKRDAGAKRL